MPCAVPSAWRSRCSQRRSEGTLSLEGQRFEIPSQYRHLQRIHLRYARWDLSSIDLLEARHGSVLSPIYPLDKSANADGQRRALGVINADPIQPTQSGMAPLAAQADGRLCRYRRAACVSAH